MATLSHFVPVQVFNVIVIVVIIVIIVAIVIIALSSSNHLFCSVIPDSSN